MWQKPQTIGLCLIPCSHARTHQPCPVLEHSNVGSLRQTHTEPWEQRDFGLTTDYLLPPLMSSSSDRRLTGG